jgi:acid phosphatase
MSTTRRDFVKTLFMATAQATLCGPLLSRGLFAAEPGSGGLNFLIFGDWGRKGQVDQVAVARQMALGASQIDASFVVSVGDNFYDYGVDSPGDPQWKASFEDVYSAASLQVPWNVILGNHDYRGNCQAQIDYSSVSPRWRMPSRYYARTENLPGGSLAEMLYIDTSPFVPSYAKDARMGKEVASQDTAKQIEWIDRTLSESKAPWKIVIGHHPIYSGGEHGDTPALIERVLPLFQKHGVQAYFNGHDHDLQHLAAGPLQLFCTGAGSTVRPVKKADQGLFALSQPGFVAVCLKPEEMEVRMITSNGEIVHSATVPRILS